MPKNRGLWRKCRGCGRSMVTSADMPDEGRHKLATTFAIQHWQHYLDVEPVLEPKRCADCGLLLLWDWGCPLHVFSASRLGWGDAVAAAYHAVIEDRLHNHYVPLAVVMPAAVHQLQLAWALAEKWEWRENNWVRPALREKLKDPHLVAS